MGTSRRQQSKHNRRKRSIPRRYFKVKPRGMKDAEVVGIVSKIDKEHEAERQEKRARIQSDIDKHNKKIYGIKQQMQANDRQIYHDMRLSESNRQHDSTMCRKADTTKRQSKHVGIDFLA